MTPLRFALSHLALHQFPLPCHLLPCLHICVSEHSWHQTFPNTTITSSINSPSHLHSRLLPRRSSLFSYPLAHWINIYPRPLQGPSPSKPLPHPPDRTIVSSVCIRAPFISQCPVQWHPCAHSSLLPNGEPFTKAVLCGSIDWVYLMVIYR